MKSLHNIEKSEFRNNAYTGWDSDGTPYLIHIKPLMGWVAVKAVVYHPGTTFIRAPTLKELSAKLAKPIGE